MQKYSGMRQRSAFHMTRDLLIYCASLAVALPKERLIAQTQPLISGQSRASVTESMNRLNLGDYGHADIEALAHEHATQAIPKLEQAFVNEPNIITKDKMADALVRLGDRRLEYWDFLVAQATVAASSESPSEVRNDGLPGTAPEFTSWVKAHHLTEDVVLKQRFQDGVAILALAETSDRRSIPLLRRALSSKNSLSQSYAAMGLAQLSDVRSVPYIIAACRSNPVAAEAIAQWLVYFDDTQAQNAANLYLGEEHAQAARDARARGQKPFN